MLSTATAGASTAIAVHMASRGPRARVDRESGCMAPVTSSILAYTRVSMVLSAPLRLHHQPGFGFYAHVDPLLSIRGFLAIATDRLPMRPIPVLVYSCTRALAYSCSRVLVLSRATRTSRGRTAPLANHLIA